MPKLKKSKKKKKKKNKKKKLKLKTKNLKNKKPTIKSTTSKKKKRKILKIPSLNYLKKSLKKIPDKEKMKKRSKKKDWLPSTPPKNSKKNKAVWKICSDLNNRKKKKMPKSTSNLMKKKTKPKKSERPWNTFPKLKPMKLLLFRNNTTISLTNKKRNNLKLNKKWSMILWKLNITLPLPNVMIQILSLLLNGKLLLECATDSLKTLESKNT